MSENSQPFLREQFTRIDAAFFVARAISVYGERKGANVDVMVSEWHDAFRFYSRASLEEAWKAYRNSSQFFPTPAGLLDQIRSRSQPAGLPQWAPGPSEPFCHDGRTEAEEIAHRASQVLQWKRDHAVAHDETAEDVLAKRAAPAPASQVTAISDAVRFSCAAKRARGEPTCTPNCATTCRTPEALP